MADSHYEQLIAYLAGELDDKGKRTFEEHLTACGACREELRQLEQVWNVLPYSMEEEELPEELKLEVMSAINQVTGTPPKAGDDSGSETIVSHKRSIRRFWHTRYSVASAAIVLLLLSIAWYGASQRGDPIPAEAGRLDVPAQVVNTYRLNPPDSAKSSASGQAWLMNKGGSLQLVLHTSGLSALQGEQVYQVWLIKDGSRLNGGTFRVDPSGSGVLTYVIDGKDRPFDAIGITLEPDPGGTQPRGNKVLGT